MYKRINISVMEDIFSELSKTEEYWNTCFLKNNKVS